jgi:ribonucleoside-triphosphate reductase
LPRFKKEICVRTLEDIDRDLAAAREALSSVEGTPAEVYSRIVGYYRSVRNWNRGKREEYKERKLFDVSRSMGKFREQAGTARHTGTAPGTEVFVSAYVTARLLLFVRPACPACPSAKEAAKNLGIPVDLVNADTETGLAEAVRRNVFSTPTAILLSNDGAELRRAHDSRGIEALGELAAV